MSKQSLQHIHEGFIYFLYKIPYIYCIKSAYKYDVSNIKAKKSVPNFNAPITVYCTYISQICTQILAV